MIILIKVNIKEVSKAGGELFNSTVCRRNMQVNETNWKKLLRDVTWKLLARFRSPSASHLRLLLNASHFFLHPLLAFGIAKHEQTSPGFIKRLFSYLLFLFHISVAFSFSFEVDWILMESWVSFYFCCIV